MTAKGLSYAYLVGMLGKKLNILLVDNDAEEHGFFKDAMRKIRHYTHSVKSFFDGVDLVKYISAEEKPQTLPDVIFLDLHMPLMGGLDTLKKIRANELYKNVPVYILSSSYNLEDFRLCNIAGAFGFFTKGSHLEKLTSQLKGILKELPAKLY